MNRKKTVVNVAELANPDWNFIQNWYPDQHTIDWQYFSARPRNILERLVQRPKISRYRACLQATRALQQAQDIVISHLPRMSHWQSIFMLAARKHQRHLAFSFNFTQLPGTRLRRAMHNSLARIERIAVYSQFERQYYADYFDLPVEKFDHLFWAMNQPDTDEHFSLPAEAYYCAAGGEGRDYATLLETFRQLPSLNLIIVTRPYAMQGLTPPDNVTVQYNLEPRAFWRVIQGSKALSVPLLNDRTACGHITLVGAMTLGTPIISSFSHGTSDYLVTEHNSIVVPGQDPFALAQAIKRLQDTPELAEKLSKEAKQFAQTNCNPTQWAHYVQQFIEA